MISFFDLGLHLTHRIHPYTVDGFVETLGDFCSLILAFLFHWRYLISTSRIIHYIWSHGNTLPGLFSLDMPPRNSFKGLMWVGVVGVHCPPPRNTPLPLIYDSMSRPLVYSSSSLRRPWDQFTPALRDYLRALYIFTHSDHKTILIPVVLCGQCLSLSLIHKSSRV